MSSVYRVQAAVDKAIAAAECAYEFNPGSYTAAALSDIVAVRTQINLLACRLEEGRPSMHVSNNRRKTV